MSRPALTVLLAAWISVGSAAEPAPASKPPPAPAHADVAYGRHARQRMDVWLPAPASKPSPVVFYVHGGGWAAHDKTDIHEHLDVAGLLQAGLAIVSVEYRFLADANAAGVSPPLQWPLQDAARALQFVRSKAPEWLLDKSRIAATGVSAGGCSVLWLAMHDDMAEPQSSDAVARESTRVLFTATKAPQPSLDPQQLVEWVPNTNYGGHAFGYREKTRPEAFAPFLANRDRHLDDLRRYSPMSHASADDPPAYIIAKADKTPVKGEPQTDPSHSAVLGLMLQATLQPLGVKCEVHHPLDGQPEATLQSLLLQHLQP